MTYYARDLDQRNLGRGGSSSAPFCTRNGDVADREGTVEERRSQGEAGTGGVVALIRVHARSVLGFVVAALLGAVAACSGPPSAATETSPSAQPANPAWEVCFTPPPGCTNVVVKALGAGQTSVLVQAYTFTSASIAKALLDAHHRGVKVEVVLDKSQRSAQYSSADFLARADIPVKIDAVHAIAHNKVMIIDGVTVLTGSFNFTRAADQKNAENLLVTHDRALADRYAENWRGHAAHSQDYVAK